MGDRTHALSENQRNWLIDLVALITLVVVYAPRGTGTPLHEWISVVLSGVIVVHLVVHWRWIIDVARRMFGRLHADVRINLGLNAALFVVMVVAIASGVLISEAALPMIGIVPPHSRTWRGVHEVSANLALIIVALHLGLHLRWAMQVARRWIAPHNATPGDPGGAQ